PAAVVGLHQHADRPGAGLSVRPPGGGPDPAFEAVADHARAAPDVALGNGPRARRVDRFAHVLGPRVLPVDVGQPPVPCLGSAPILPACVRVTVTPVRTGPQRPRSGPSPRIEVASPTLTPGTSVIALCGPGEPRPISIPSWRALMAGG